MATAHTIKVKCATWDQVEEFYTRKVVNERLVLRLPTRGAPGSTVTIALVMPTGLVFALDALVEGTGALDDRGKYPVALRMVGLTDENKLRLVRLVHEGRGDVVEIEILADDDVPVATPADAPLDEVVERRAEPGPEAVLPEEKQAFEQLDAIRRRHQELAAHAVLGVPVEATPQVVRKAYLALAKKHHPDVYGRFRSPAVRHLAQQVFLHVNRAYDRMRQAFADQGVPTIGPARADTSGWVTDVVAAPDDDPLDEASEVNFESAVRTPLKPEEIGGEDEAVALAAAGREQIQAGAFAAAREDLARALRAHPRNRQLRALYHVASGFEMRERGRTSEAQLHLETALRHDKDCELAASAIGTDEAAPAPEKPGLFRRLWGRGEGGVRG